MFAVKNTKLHEVNLKSHTLSNLTSLLETKKGLLLILTTPFFSPPRLERLEKNDHMLYVSFTNYFSYDIPELKLSYSL